MKVNAMPTCAYCGAAATLTREHVIPAFLYKAARTSAGIVGWAEVPKKLVRGEQKIKDVCGDCNNGVLSQLDSYAKSVLEEAGLLTDNFLRRELILKYDFDMLLRWGLKVSYNSARVEGSHAWLFEPFKEFILNGGTSPPRGEIALAAELLAPYVVPQDRRSEIAATVSISADGRMNPLIMRVGWAPEFERSNVCRLRMLVVGPLVLYVMIFLRGIPTGLAASTFRGFMKRHGAAVEVTRSLRAIVLRQSSITCLDCFAPQIKYQKMLQPV